MNAYEELDLDKFTQQYLETALWASTDDDDEPLDAQYDIDDFAPEAIKQAKAETARFQTENKKSLLEAGNDSENGHDFWLTRNGHGTGFWDRGYDEDIEEKLTAASEAFGETWIYVGDDGKLYFM